MRLVHLALLFGNAAFVVLLFAIGVAVWDLSPAIVVGAALGGFLWILKAVATAQRKGAL